MYSNLSGAILPFRAMDVLERALEHDRCGRAIAHLEVGEPDFDVPDCVKSAMEKALRDGGTHYTHSLGELELREEIASYYSRVRGCEVSPDQIVVTAGTSGGLLLLMRLLLDPGDEVLLADPGYACYPNFVVSSAGAVRRFPVREAAGWKINPSDAVGKVTPQTRAVLLNSPSNPTGASQSVSCAGSFLDADVPVISDEIYQGLEYGPDRAPTLAGLAGAEAPVFVLDGCSKRWAMTGIRIGWIVAPRGAMRRLQSLQQNLFICASSVAQAGALAALRFGACDAERMRLEYARRRDLLVDGLRRLGFSVPHTPDGAYYILAGAHHLDGDSLRLAFRILEEAAVGVGPGIDFGPGGEGYLRFSYAASMETLELGLARLQAWLESR